MLLDRSSTIEFRIIFYENRSVSQNPKKQSIPHGYTFSIVFFFLHLKTVCEEKYLSFIYFFVCWGVLCSWYTPQHILRRVSCGYSEYIISLSVSLSLSQEKKKNEPLLTTLKNIIFPQTKHTRQLIKKNHHQYGVVFAGVVCVSCNALCIK